jgi:hypothetical protein
MIGITTAGIVKSLDDFAKMRDVGIEQIDCSITSILGKPSLDVIDLDEVSFLRENLKSNSIRCNSLQSFFYGANFDFDDESLLNSYLGKCFDIAETLDCDTLLFGSPHQRKNILSTVRLVKRMNSFASARGKTIAIENLDMFEGVWGKNAIDVQKEINETPLKSCSMNLHVFVEDLLDVDTLDIEKIKSIHLSNKDYSVSFLENANLNTLEKIKNLYVRVGSVCVEVVNCSPQKIFHEFENFRNMWEKL